MQFYSYQTTRDLVGKGVPSSEFYGTNFSWALDGLCDKCTAMQMVSEGLWERHQRPYYNVYPAIAPALLKLNLACDTGFIKPPFESFSIRMPQDHPILEWEWDGRKWHVHSVLIGPGVLRSGGAVFDGLMIWVNTGEVRRMPDGRDYPIHTYINLPLEEGMSLEAALKALPYDPSAFHGLVMPNEIRTACARLVCAICLLDNDPDLIEPDVLSKDRQKYDQTHSQVIVDRARRRGKLGWNIGRGIEVAPHTRIPHLCLYWTKRGRTVPVVRKRRGSIVHREVVTRVPTGFQGEASG